MARRQRGSSNATFDEFFSAFSKSVRADVRLENSEIVVSHSGDLLNEALVSTGDATTHSNLNSRPATRSSPVGKTAASLPRLNPRSPGKPTATKAAVIQDIQLPTHLTALTALQASDGSWRFDDKFQYVIDDVASPPPDGISPKLWATAVVLTIFRQFPEYFAQLEPAYDKAMLHVDENVLRVAKTQVDITPEAMKRIRPYQNNEAKLIRERLAREAAAKRAEEDAEERRLALERQKIVTISKYSMFRAKRLPIETQELMVSSLASEVQAIFPGERKPPQQMRPPELEIRAGEAVECCWRRVDGSKRPKVHSQWWLCLVTAVHSDGKSINVHYLVDAYEREQNVRLKYVRLTEDDAHNRRAAALESLKQTWEEPLPLNNELARLHEVDKRCKWRKPWEIRSLPSLPTYQLTENDHSRPPSSLSTRRRLTAAALETIDKRLQQSDAAVESLYQQAVDAALAYDKIYAQIRPAFKNAIKWYASAVLFSERFHAFDQFLDVAVQLITVAVAALERIEAWVSHGSCSEDHLAPGTTRISRMFVWGGHDFIVGLLRSLDFVGSRQPAVQWYGEDFAFSLNPFLMAESIRDLVEDRGLQFTAKFTPIEAENGLRVALRMHTNEDQDGSATRDIPTWWPQARYDIDLLSRIKMAENFVLDYLQVMDILR